MQKAAKKFFAAFFYVDWLNYSALPAAHYNYQRVRP
jgi:hypothetical protein